MRSRSPIAVLALKELTQMVHSPATYVIGFIFLVLTGWFFASTLFASGQSSLDAFIQPLPLLFTFIIPALSMRSFSEELKGGTIEYLSTLPLKDYEIVLGKYLALMGLLGLLLLFTLVYPVSVLVIGDPDSGRMICSYLAVIGLGSFFIAAGLWASSLTRNQVVAFIIGFAVAFFFFVLDRIADFSPGVLSSGLRTFGIISHFESMSRGVISSRDVIYWLSGTLLFLSATLATLHSRRWR